MRAACFALMLLCGWAGVASSDGLRVAALVDFYAPIGSDFVDLEWIAPSDNVGVTQYDMRFSTAPITAANFASAPQIANEPTPPLPPGQLQWMRVFGLTANTTYYFALKAGDLAGNWSNMSNVVSARTLPPPDTSPPTTPTLAPR